MGANTSLQGSKAIALVAVHERSSRVKAFTVATIVIATVQILRKRGGKQLAAGDPHAPRRGFRPSSAPPSAPRSLLLSTADAHVRAGLSVPLSHGFKYFAKNAHTSFRDSFAARVSSRLK